jgi:hypothetical protein
MDDDNIELIYNMSELENLKCNFDLYNLDGCESFDDAMDIILETIQGDFEDKIKLKLINNQEVEQKILEFLEVTRFDELKTKIINAQSDLKKFQSEMEKYNAKRQKDN